jgi:hypothetical protein
MLEAITALVEVGHHDAERGAIDDIAGDHGALEAELGIERHLAETRADVAGDLQVGGGVAAHRREGRPLDAVAAHTDVAGAKDVDGVPVLPRPAGAGRDILDAVVEHQRAVIARLRAPHQDAVVAGAPNRVAGDSEALGIAREDRGTRCIRDARGGHLALGPLEQDAVSARVHERAVADAHPARLGETDEGASFRQRQPGAVERQSFERHVLRVRRDQQRGRAGKDQARGAAHTDELRPGRKPQPSRAVDAGREHERHAGAGRPVDGGLQSLRLVVRAAGAHAEVGGVQSQMRQRSGRRPPRQGRKRRGGGSASGKAQKAASVKGHAGGSGLRLSGWAFPSSLGPAALCRNGTAALSGPPFHRVQPVSVAPAGRRWHAARARAPPDTATPPRA